MLRYLLLFLIPVLSFTQVDTQLKDTLRGKIISSVTSKRPYHNIYIQEKNTNNMVMADEEGVFSLIVDKGKAIYNLEIKILGYDTFKYVYQEKWIDRKLPKHMVVEADCSFSKKEALRDNKNSELKLFISGGIVPVSNTKKDIRFEKKYNIKYVDFGCEAYNFDCIKDYNKQVSLILNIKYGYKWREKVRKDVIGLNNTNESK